MRFIIPGSGPGAAAGQVFLSRSSGVVVSGVRVPKPAQGLAYQLWLLTDAEPMAAGTFTPDETGRVIFAADAPRVTGQVIGMLISVEPAGGSEQPTSTPILIQQL